jgi:L,D-peptidoglycan transpeptidase YkuD (ErfK/YbiS/YcfS/YnhG family)
VCEANFGARTGARGGRTFRRLGALRVRARLHLGWGSGSGPTVSLSSIPPLLSVILLVFLWLGSVSVPPAAGVSGGTPSARSASTAARARASASSGGAATAVAAVSSSDGRGYWLAASDGGVFTFGDATFYGSAGALHLNAPIVGMAATPDAHGYWLAASDGGIFTFGDATFYGSAGALHLNAPIVGLAATPDGRGYWLVASDGGVFSFGDASYFGSTGGLHLHAPIVDMAVTPDGRGYWLVGSDGGIFTFGDATFYGSAGALHLNAPVVGLAATPDGHGYWLVGSDGGMFTFGDASYFGSTGGLHLNAPMAGLATTPSGRGYWLLGSDGGIFTFGNATFYGSGTAEVNPLLVDQLATTDGAQQVIVVDAPSAASTTATLSTFENDGNGWYQVFAPMPARDGANGWIAAADRHEGDGTTPEGIYGIGSTMYGTEADPGTHFAYHQLVCGDWWDEDTSSSEYNTFQHVACGSQPSFGGDSEALWTEGNAYPSMAVIDFNTPTTGPIGSGIFLHSDLGVATQGCISLPHADLVQVLDWLNPARHPVIVMGPDSVVRSF